MSELVGRMFSDGIENVLFVGGFHQIEGLVPPERPMSDQIIDDYAKRLSRVFKNYPEAHLLDMQPVFKGHDEFYFLDGIHPSPDGSAEIARQVYLNLQELD